MFADSSIVWLLTLLLAYVAVSLALRARQNALGLSPSRKLKSAIRVGIVWINLPVLPIMVAPLAVQKHFWPHAHIAISACVFLAGFLAAWAWWSINVSLWRRWAARRGIDPESLQWEGESSSLLWPKGHFFERTEFDQLRKRYGS